MSDTDEKKRLNPAVAVAVLFVLPALVLLFSVPKLHFPTAQWDGWALDAVVAIRSGTFALKPYIIHTPLYLYVLALSQKLFGGDPLENARLFGYACYLATGWLVFAISRGMSGKRSAAAAGLIGAALYFSSPLAVQGALLIDLGDTSLVPLTASVYFFLLTCVDSKAQSAMLLAAAFALNIWAKMIHSFFLAVAAVAEAVFSKKDKAMVRNMQILLAGIAFFSVTWVIYAFMSLKAADRWTPMWYLVNEMLFNFWRKDYGVGFNEVIFAKITNSVRIIMWIWAPLLLWAWRVAKRGFGVHPEKYLNYFIIIFLLVSWVSKGTSNGFPKYHMVLLPLLCAMGGGFAAEELAGTAWRLLFPAAALAAAAGGLIIYFSGDPFYTFNYGFKSALINHSGLTGQALRLVLEMLAPAAAALLLFWSAARYLNKKESALFSLLAAGLIWQAALGCRQAGADYFTTYGYGTRGKAETVEYLRDNMKRGAVFCPNEFTWELERAGVSFLNVNDACQMSRACVLADLRDKGTGAFVFGQASNTAAQMAVFMGLTPEQLGRNFSKEKKGDFWICVFDEEVGQ